MLNIFVLEDDFKQQSRIERAIREEMASRSLSYRRLEIFGKPQQLIDAVEEKGSHQVFFFDIEIKGEEKKGMEVAREIRQKDKNAIIVFVTTHSEFMPLTYKYRVSALDFIDKGLNDEEFQAAVGSVLEHAAENTDQTIRQDAFTYKSKYSHVQVPFSDILFFEASSTPHKVVLVTKKDSIEFYGKLSEIVKMDDCLYSSHRSYVVNPENITHIDRSNHLLHFDEGEYCPVSRLKIKGLLEKMEKEL